MSNGRFLLLVFMLLAVAALVAQIFIDFSANNLASASIVFSSSILVLLYLMWTPALRTHPVSSFAVLGLNATTQMGALIGQSISWTSLTDNLRQPIETFALLAVFQVTALLAHTGYRLLLAPDGALAESPPRKLLRAVGVYLVPSSGALWFMGYVGLFSFFLGVGEGTVAKVIQGFNFLTWAPFLIPLYMHQQGSAYAQPARQYPWLVFYTLLIVLFGLAINTRRYMLFGVMTIALVFLLATLRNEEAVAWRKLARISLVGLFMAAMAIPLTDLATAMVVARKARGSVSIVDMVPLTFRYYNDPAALEAERESRGEASTLKSYDEFYFDNPLLARLVETKFHDNALSFATTLSASDRQDLATTSLELALAILPKPVINALGLRIDKEALQFTMGDYLAHLSVGTSLGGYRTGSALAQGWALLGVGFFPVYLLICMLIFAVVDLLSSRDHPGRQVLSAVVMLGIWRLFQSGLTADSIHAWLGFFVRALPQNILIFLLCLGVAKVWGGLFKGSSPRPQPLGHAPHPS